MHYIMKHLHPAKILVIGYLFYSIIGCLLLSLPISHEKPIAFIDNFFTAIAAVSTTGLSTINLWTNYNFFGQIIILLLIQLGGIGYMTFSSFILLCTTQKLSAYRKKIGTSTFSFPKDFSIQEFIGSVMLYSLLCELIGAALLTLVFWEHGIESYLWYGIFHSISAFCTAGLSLFNNGFIPFKDNTPFNLIISILAILGSLGFIVPLDFYKRFTGSKTAISFTTKVILFITFAFLFFGTILFFFLSAPVEETTLFQKWMVSFFQITSATTTMGFYTMDIASLSNSTLILLTFLSTFGSAPSGTGGGLKNTAFASLYAFVKNTLKGQPASLWNHEIPSKRIKIATVAFVYYVFMLSTGVFLLSLTEIQSISWIFFEVANALNNSGLSIGFTDKLTNFGKVLIALSMLMGRVGVLTFGVAISSQKDEKNIPYKKAELVI